MNFAHWVNWVSGKDNVVFATDRGFGLGSCGVDNLFSANQKFDAGEPPESALGKDQSQWVEYKNIERIRYVQESCTVSIEYHSLDDSARKKSQALTLQFDCQGKTADFVEHVGECVRGSLIKIYGDRFEGFGAVLMGLGVLIATVIGIAFFQKSKIIAFLLPTLIVLGSTVLAVYCTKISASVQRWVTKKETKVVDPFSMVTLCGGIVFTVAAVLFAQTLPDSHGRKSLYDAAMASTLNVRDVQVYLDRGANLDYVDSTGRSALWWSIKHAQNDVSLQLLHQGASVKSTNGKLLEHALSHATHEEVVILMLHRGALDVAEATGNFDTQAHLSDDDTRFASVFERFRQEL